MAVPAPGATLPIYINNGTVNNPQIDATAVVNNGTINTTTSLPYDTANTLFYTNNLSGRMNGSAGFRLEFVTNTFRLPAADVVNKGVISGTTHLLVTATNITNSGTMAVGPQGLVRLTGNSVNLSRGGVGAGSSVSSAISDGFDFPPYYQNASDVTDLYWGGGTNGTIVGNTLAANQLRLSSFLSFPFLQSPFHQVVFPGDITNFVAVPSFFFGRQFDAFVHTNQAVIGVTTQRIVQVVFVPADVPAELTTQVRFDTSGFGVASSPIVEFSVTDLDISTGQPLTSYVYLTDSMPLLGLNAFDLLTNIDNFVTPVELFKPEAYQIRRTTPFNWLFAEPENATYDNSLLVGPYVSNQVQYAYLGYSAQIGESVSFFSTTPATTPSNAPGRVEIAASTLDLNRARIRSDNFINITTTNLVGTTNAAFDAPFINFKFKTTNSSLVLDSLAASSVRRLQGSLSVWSGLWGNRTVVGGTPFTFHVMIIDHDFQGTLPVTFGDFSATGNNLVVDDSITPVLSFGVNAPALTVGTNGALNIPADAGITQFPTLRYLTNYGQINVANSAVFGNDAPQPYVNFINRGTVSAASLSVSAQTLDNGGILSATGGPLLALFTSATITNARLQAIGDIQLSGTTLDVTNSTFQTGAALILNVTGRLSDGDSNSSNSWSVNDGLHILTKPATGDLLGTTVRSVATQFASVTHRFAMENRGVTTNGYGNNAALGRLVLDGGAGSEFVFSGVGTNDAVYVDYLDLRNDATNYLTALAFNPNITVYFADASLPAEKLDGAHNGHLRWVSGYAGAFSSITVTNSDGSTTVVNRALRDSSTIDSDADGIPNRYDEFPFDPVAISLSLSRPGSGDAGPASVTAMISWEAAANTTYRVECKKTFGGPWEFLRNYTHGPKNGTATVADPVSTNGACFYRVTYFH